MSETTTYPKESDMDNYYGGELDDGAADAYDATRREEMKEIQNIESALEAMRAIGGNVAANEQRARELRARLAALGA